MAGPGREGEPGVRHGGVAASGLACTRVLHPWRVLTADECCYCVVHLSAGRFEKDMQVTHTRTGKTIRLSAPSKLFAQRRETIEVAYPGDIVG